MEPIGVSEFIVCKTPPHVPDYKDFWNVETSDKQIFAVLIQETIFQ